MKYCWVWQLIKTSSIVALNVVANPATVVGSNRNFSGFSGRARLLQKMLIFLIQFLLNIYKNYKKKL